MQQLLGKAIPYRSVEREKERVTWFEVLPPAEALRELARQTSPNRRFVALEGSAAVKCEQLCGSCPTGRM